MYATLLGTQGFRAGMDLYFKRHDGQAVTCDDFFSAMADANKGVDIEALKPWYRQAGTPTLTVSTSYDVGAQTYTLVASQAMPKTADVGGDAPKEAQLIPIRMGLLSESGKVLPLGALSIDGGSPQPLNGAREVVLPLRKGSALFTLTGVTERPAVPSLLRDFSAPVHLKVQPPLSEEQLALLLAHDSDTFNRFEAAAMLSSRLVLRVAAAAEAGNSEPAPKKDAGWPALVTALRAVLTAGLAGTLDRVFVSEALTLPAVSELLTQAGPSVDPVRLFRARAAAEAALALELRPDLEAAFGASGGVGGQPYEYTQEGVQARAFRGLAVRLLSKLPEEPPAELPAEGGAEPQPSGLAAVVAAYYAASNMTDAAAALAALASRPGPAREAALEHFYGKWKDNTLVVNKWLSARPPSAPPSARRVQGAPLAWAALHSAVAAPPHF